MMRFGAELFLGIPAFLDVLYYAIIIAVGFMLYRLLGLKVIPWIAAHYLLQQLVSFPSSWIGHKFPAPSLTVPLVGLSPKGVVYVLAAIIGILAELLIVLLVLSEFVFLAAQVRPEVTNSWLKLLLAIHRRVNIYGGVMIVLTIIVPLPVFLLWWSNHG